MAGKPFYIFGLVERKLRKANRLQPDDRLVELRVGTLLYTAYDGTPHVAPPRTAIRALGCTYSARRLFFGGEGRIAADLADVVYVEARERELAVVYLSPEINEVRWRWMDSDQSQDLAAFAERIVAQRTRRVAEVGEEDQMYRRLADPRVASAIADVWVGRWQPT